MVEKEEACAERKREKKSVLEDGEERKACWTVDMEMEMEMEMARKERLCWKMERRKGRRKKKAEGNGK